MSQCDPFAVAANLHFLQSASELARAAFGPPSVEQALVSEIMALRASEQALASEAVALRELLAQWQDYAEGLRAQNEEMRIALLRPVSTGAP